MVNSQINIEDNKVQQANKQFVKEHIDIHSYVNYYTNQKTNKTQEEFEVFYYANQATFFGIWKENVTVMVLRNLGLNVLDIPDFPYYDCFTEGIMPDQMVQHIANNLP